MGKLDLFMIQLDNPTGVYYPGQTVQGNVTVRLNAEMKMRGIRVTVHGSANVRWTETHSTGSGKNRRTTTRVYSNHEEYFNVTLTVYGKAPGQTGDDLLLAAGQYVYPFSVQLPQGLPSSFEGAWGRVRYWVKGTIDRPWRFDHNTKCAFTVISQLDLNQQQTAMIDNANKQYSAVKYLSAQDMYGQIRRYKVFIGESPMIGSGAQRDLYVINN